MDNFFFTQGSNSSGNFMKLDSYLRERNSNSRFALSTTTLNLGQQRFQLRWRRDVRQESRHILKSSASNPTLIQMGATGVMPLIVCGLRQNQFIEQQNQQEMLEFDDSMSVHFNPAVTSAGITISACRNFLFFYYPLTRYALKKFKK